MPGCQKADVECQVVENRLSINCKKPESCKLHNMKSESSYRFKDRSSGIYRLTLPLPNDVDTDDVKKFHASFDNGLLHVKFDKRKGASPQKKLTIK